jgi:hypothetical protein
MFGLFKDPKEKLEKKYQQLLAEAHRLSHIDRKKSDLKTAEAEEVRKQIEALEAKASK